MSILKNTENNGDKIMNDDKKTIRKPKNRGKSPTTSEKSMNINYNPDKAH